MTTFHLEIDKLSVGYRGQTLIHNINFQAHQGEIITLIGPNGAGKSTILKTLCAQLRPTGGSVYLNGHAVASTPSGELAKSMAVMLTERVRPEMMRCYDVVATGRYPYTGRMGLLGGRDRQVIREIMDKTQVSAFADRAFNQVSDGQRQLTFLARALCQEPAVLVLDEPTAFLDIQHKVDLLHTLRTMAREKHITVLLSLHEIDLAQKVSDRVICVKGDTLFRMGTPQEIFTEDTISALYGLKNSHYNVSFGSVELPKPAGNPRVFVLCGGGCAAHVFRALQREGTPFSAGIVYPGDSDWHLAKALACEVIEERPFCVISDETLTRARAAMDTCDRIINAGAVIGESNARMQALIDEARNSGKESRL